MRPLAWFRAAHESVGTPQALAWAAVLGIACVCAVPVRAQDAPASRPRPSTDERAHAQDQNAAAARRAQLLRRSNTYLGPVGGIHVLEAGSGAPRSFRVQTFADFFRKDGYLYDHDHAHYAGGALSLSVTPIEHLEVSAAVSARSVKDPAADPEVVQSVGDPYLDGKGYATVAPGVTVGGDLQLAFLTAPSNKTVDYAGTSVGLRANVSLDLREMDAHVPIELRFNGGYYFDQSRKVMEQTERDRLASRTAEQIAADPTGESDFQHFARRNERLAYGVNRVDQVMFALGLEAPLALSERVAFHPIAEWEFGIPVNRQGFDCSVVRLASGAPVPGQDSCLSREGAGVWPQRFTAGARIFPVIPGLNFLAAVEVGIGGTKTFVRELAPMPPYRVMFSASYAVDVMRQQAPTREVEMAPQVVHEVEGRVQGAIIERGTALPVPAGRVRFSGPGLSTVLADEQGRFVSPRAPGDAQVASERFSGQGLSAVLADDQGRFLSYPFGPGDVRMEIEADGYEPGVCNARIPAQGGTVLVNCELQALPRVGSISGRVLGTQGALTGARIELTGPLARTLQSDADGRFHEDGLTAGDYQARIEQPGYFISVTQIHVAARRESAVDIQLQAKPAQPHVTVLKTKLALHGTIYFETNTANLQPRSEPLLTEIADVLLRAPEIQLLEVQGHTDDVGTPEYNLELSQKRADAVRDWLVRAGVSADRLVAKGYGRDKPIARNTAGPGRAKNRRVEFMILQRAESDPAP